MDLCWVVMIEMLIIDFFYDVGFIFDYLIVWFVWNNFKLGCLYKEYKESWVFYVFGDWICDYFEDDVVMVVDGLW